MKKIKLNQNIFCLLSLVLIIISASSCRTTGSLDGKYFRKKGHEYQVGSPKEGWRKLNLSGADLAWINPEENSTILVNSDCKENKDLPLRALTVQLLIGLTEQSLVSQKTKPWAGREALETILTAKIDGVLRKLNIFVLKKDGCVYDIIFSAPPHFYDKEISAYYSVLNQFQAEGTQ